jgi:WD40 repeat protein
MRALERRIEADLLIGRDAQLLVDELEQLVSDHPFREELRADLMLALYRSGRQAEALDVYHQTRKMLGEELGIEASPALRELAGRVLRQEPSLAPDAPARGADQARRAAAIAPLRNPYKGLRAFGEADAEDFFGREAISRELLAKVEQSRLVAVVGPTGSGKSSLVRAGLVPMLRSGALDGSGDWLIAAMSPGSHPLEELESALLRVAVNPPATLLEQLEHDERGLCRAVKRVLPEDSSQLVLLVDQLEELFTLVADEGRRSSFLTLLERAVDDSRSRLRVVVTLRADFYDRPLRYRGLAELLRDHVVAVTPLAPHELEQAISAPALGAGVALEAGLLARMVADVLDAPGALPLLQYALSELFEQREGTTMTGAAYQRIGGVPGALAGRADEIFASLSETARVTARQLFLRLVAGGDAGPYTRRPVDLSELASLDVDQAALNECLELFGAARLITFSRDPRSGAATVEVAHEALLSEWGQLREWVDEAREDVLAHRRLSVRAAEWDEASRDPSFLLRGSNLARFEAWSTQSGLAQTERERAFLQASLAERQRALLDEESRRARETALERRSVLRLRALVAVLAVATLAAAGLTVYAFDQSGRAHAQARIATARQLAAASDANLDVDPELSILLAREAVKEAGASGAALPTAVGALHRAIAASRVVLTIRTPATAAIAVSPDGSHLVTAGSTSSAQTVDQQTGSRLGAHTAVVWDATTGKRLLTLRSEGASIDDVAYSRNGSSIATGGSDGAATVWNARSGRRLFVLRGSDGAGGFLSVSFSPDGTLLATADRLDRIRIWNLRTHRMTRTISSSAPLCGIAWSPSGALIGAGQCGSYNFSPNLETRVWSARTGRLVFHTRGLPTTSELQWAPDGRSFITPTLSGTAQIWDVTDGRLTATLVGHTGQVDAVAYSSKSNLVATGGTDGTARVWNARTGRQLLVLHGHSATVNAVAFTPDGRRLITAGEDGTARIWDITTEGSRDWLTLAAHPGGVGRVIYTPDGTRLLTTGTCDGKTKLWNATTGSLIRTYTTGFTEPGACATQSTGQYYATVEATSPDGKLGASAESGGGTQIVDTASGRLVRTLAGGHGGAQSIAFDGSGTRIATGDWDGTTVVWDVASGRRLWTLAGHNGIVESVVFSPDGTTLATAGDDATAKLWDLRTGKLALTLTGHTFALTDVQFNPSGTRLATASGDGTVRVYVLPVGQLLAVARSRLTRTWTPTECKTYLPHGTCPTP